ncbi:hypothetical protein [Halalkalibacter nanhaiisediminis]|uniref:Uncharacterized protein n=1 Tax=Halalkalibacter nanhaiisediminis TaxID=688079 RepID=A0A562QNT8_9BACI|nr:hypothetical protein [Halalkalibacter nanhaiisediminis]TWI57860.1 hypothetical protein IQ10_01189 [Halalkalibacter nanhaiisediminis]
MGQPKQPSDFAILKEALYGLGIGIIMMIVVFLFVHFGLDIKAFT